MIPFPGESMPVWDGWSSVGNDWTLPTDILERANHRVINAGDQWRCWAYAGDQVYLDEPGLSLSVSWVIEVLSGSATLTLREGTDAAFAYDTGATLPTSLGTLTVTGAGTYVVPVTFTDAQVTDYATGALALSIDCTAGSCDVQQVKLRVWPATGVVGGYVTQPAWDEATFGDIYAAGSAATFGALETGAGTVAAWDALEAALPAGVMAWNGLAHTLDFVFTGGLVESFGRVRSTLLALGVYGAEVTDIPVAAAAVAPDLDTVNPINPALALNVDYIYPPNEVYGDTPTLGVPLGPATLTWGAFGALMSISYNAASGAPSTSPGGGLAVSVFASDAMPGESAPSPFTLSGGTTLVPLTDGVPVSTTIALGGGTSQSVLAFMSFTGDVALPDFSTWFPNAVVSPTGTFTYGALMDDPPVTIHHPPFQIWSPTAAEHPLRLLQRGDSLGMGSGRVLGAGTRQGSLKVFGSL